MIYEKTLKREDGSKIKIRVHIFGYSTPYFITVSVREKNKKGWVDVTEDCREFRILSHDDKIKVDSINQLAVVSELELYDAKICAWQSIKPII